MPTRGCIRAVPELQAKDVYIGRPHRDKRGRFLAGSKWANLFKVSQHGSAERAVELYASHLASSSTLLAALPKLSGARLLCHCAPGAACHGDAIAAAFARNLLTQRALPTTLLVGTFAKPVPFAMQALALEHLFECHYCSEAVKEGMQWRMASAR